MTKYLLIALMTLFSIPAFAGSIVIGHGVPDCSNVSTTARMEGCNGIALSGAFSVTFGDKESLSVDAPEDDAGYGDGPGNSDGVPGGGNDNT